MDERKEGVTWVYKLKSQKSRVKRERDAVRYGLKYEWIGGDSSSA